MNASSVPVTASVTFRLLREPGLVVSSPASSADSACTDSSSRLVDYNYDADLEVSDTCFRSSVLSRVELYLRPYMLVELSRATGCVRITRV